MSFQSALNLVVALPSEAQPLVQHFGLVLQQEKPFRVFARDDVRLVVSGMGAEASATAVGYLAGLGIIDGAWLNVGIAGHGDAARGSVMLAGRVRRQHASRAWFPGLAFDHDLPVTDVMSFDEPVTEYPPDTCCDMEAAGFMAAASRVARADLIQVCKIISDNREHGLATLNRERIFALVGAALPALEKLLDSFCAHAASIDAAMDNDAEALEHLDPGWRLSHSQRLQFVREFKRYRLLAPATMPPPGLAECTEGRAALALLRELVQHVRPGFER